VGKQEEKKIFVRRDRHRRLRQRNRHHRCCGRIQEAAEEHEAEHHTTHDNFAVTEG